MFDWLPLVGVCTVVISLLWIAYLRITYRFWFDANIFHRYNLHYYVAPPGERSITKSRTNPAGPVYNNIAVAELSCIDLNESKSTARKNPTSAQIQAFLNENHQENGGDSRSWTLQIVPALLGHKVVSRIVGKMQTIHDSETETRDVFVSFATACVVNLCVNRMQRTIFDLGESRQSLEIPASVLDNIKFDTNLYKAKNFVLGQMVEAYCDAANTASNTVVLIPSLDDEFHLQSISVPLLSFSLYEIVVGDLLPCAPAANFADNEGIRVVLCTKKNFHSLVAFLDAVKQSQQFDCTFMSEYANLLSMIDASIYYIYVLLDTRHSTVLSAFFFRRLAATTVEFVASVFGEARLLTRHKHPEILYQVTRSDFGAAFQFALDDLYRTLKSNGSNNTAIKNLLWHTTSENGWLWEWWHPRTNASKTPYFIRQRRMEYYSTGFIYWTQMPDETLLLM